MTRTILSLTHWVKLQLADQSVTLQPLYGDASRRRYFRVASQDKSYIVADVSCEKTSLLAFIELDELLYQQGLRVPDLYFSDAVHGYLIQEDFGDKTLLSQLTADNVNAFYQQALQCLYQLQSCHLAAPHPLRQYGKTLLTREWGIFTNWYLEKYQQKNLTKHQNTLAEVYALLASIFAEQPQVFVHRDYHSRNLMVLDDDELGIIDFQGAVVGPVTYDIVSLLKDCYIDWPETQRQQWLQNAHAALVERNVTSVDYETFLRWFDLTGLQRHLKVLGLFARLAMADHNEKYLSDLPRVLYYVQQVFERYPELAALKKLMEK